MKNTKTTHRTATGLASAHTESASEIWPTPEPPAETAETCERYDDARVTLLRLGTELVTLATGLPEPCECNRIDWQHVASVKHAAVLVRMAIEEIGPIAKREVQR